MTSDQETLLQKARDSLTAARLLADKVLFDFATSRAYYAMFYVAEALLIGKNLRFSSHSGVISAFGREFSRPAPRRHSFIAI